LRKSVAVAAVVAAAAAGVVVVAAAVVVASAAVAAAAAAAAVAAAAAAAAIVVAGVATSAQLRGRPEKIFVSVDESTGRSTVSFQPADVGSPVQHDDDHKGVTAMADAAAIVAKYPGCTVHGPHFHAARPAGRTKLRKRPPPPNG
jgi:ABC-type nickel/cobalt efflux system permease component RcnA